MSLLNKISKNTLASSNGFKYMYMRKSLVSGATITSYSNSIWKLRWMKIKNFFKIKN